MRPALRHTLSVEQARRCFAQACDRVCVEGHRILVTRHGRQLCALVAIPDLERLEREDATEATSLLELFLAGGTS